MTRPLYERIASEQDRLLERSDLGERLVRRLAREPLQKPAPRRFVWALVAAAAAFAGLFIALSFATPFGALAVVVDGSGGTPLLGAWIGAPSARPLPLEFSDGSRIELTPESKVRLVELARSGARVELANGTLHVHVVPRRTTDYRLDAGPFGVHVTGTRFEMSYRPERETFELFLEEGQVELTGCVFGKGRKLAAGQSVFASCRERTLDVSFGRRKNPALEGAAPHRVPPTEAALAPPEAAPKAISTESAASERNTPEKPVTPGWVALARSGDFAQAFTIANGAGFETECARASAAELSLLADVARHAKAPQKAEHAFLTLRRRFPGTNEAALSAFALGRLEFDERGAYGKAATWFRAYLSERPSGAMTREALGRLVEACYRAKDDGGAREAAVLYLRDYPSGPHAELARRVVSSP
ncbi:MAG TPA: FecR domain-containing protein [Polyangiaceae bacterium]